MDLAELKDILLNRPISDELRILEPTVEAVLRAIVRHGLPVVNDVELERARWAGVDTPEIRSATVNPDGTLCLEATPPNDAAIVSHPDRWTSDVFTSELVGHGPLVIALGASRIARFTIGNDSNVVAKLYAWCWLASPRSVQPALWAAPMRFPGTESHVLARRHGNMLLAVDGQFVRGWCFETPTGPAFVVERNDTWYLALRSSGSLVDFDAVPLLCSAVGFVLGTPFELGIFRHVDQAGPTAGLANPGLGRTALRRESNQSTAPAVPFNCHPCWTANFVQSIIAFAQSACDAPITRSINLYFASLSGFLESQFLHSWLALEVLAKWAIESGLVPDGGRLRLADHQKWVEWVNSHSREIETLAAPGMARSLVDRVRGAEIDRPTRVQRAFRGLGIVWTPEMDDAEKVRHGVAHEGALSTGPIEVPRDRARIGLVNTMLSTLLAHIVGYQGPIADRAKDPYALDAPGPSWWRAAPLTKSLEYHGTGIEELTQDIVAALDRSENNSAP